MRYDHHYDITPAGKERLLKDYADQLNVLLLSNEVCTALVNLQCPPQAPENRPSFLGPLLTSYGVIQGIPFRQSLVPHSLEHALEWAKLIHDDVYSAPEHTRPLRVSESKMAELRERDLHDLQRDIVTFNQALPLLMPPLLRHLGLDAERRRVRGAGQKAPVPLRPKTIKDYWMERMRKALQSPEWPMGEINLFFALEEGQIDANQLASLPDHVAARAKEDAIHLKKVRHTYPLARIMPKAQYDAYVEEQEVIAQLRLQSQNAFAAYKRVCASEDASQGQLDKARQVFHSLKAELMQREKDAPRPGPLDELAELDASGAVRPLVEALRSFHHQGKAPQQVRFTPRSLHEYLAVAKSWADDVRRLENRLMFTHASEQPGEFENLLCQKRKLALLEEIGGPITLLAHQRKLLQEIRNGHQGPQETNWGETMNNRHYSESVKASRSNGRH